MGERFGEFFARDKTANQKKHSSCNRATLPICHQSRRRGRDPLGTSCGGRRPWRARARETREDQGEVLKKCYRFASPNLSHFFRKRILAPSFVQTSQVESYTGSVLLLKALIGTRQHLQWKA